MVIIAQPMHDLLYHSCIFSLFTGIHGKIAERLPTPQDEIRQVAEENRRNTGNEQGSIIAYNVANKYPG